MERTDQPSTNAEMTATRFAVLNRFMMEQLYYTALACQAESADGHERIGIDYRGLDAEIRPLVEMLNDFPGIRTTDSCAGHHDSDEAYVSFVCRDRDGLALLVKALPLTRRHNWVGNQPQMQSVSVNTEWGGNSVRHILRIWGYPQYAQRQMIAEVEERPSIALSCLRPKRLSCSKRALGRNAGN